jgi:hypothetical protein
VVVAEDAAAAGECVFGEAAGSGVGTLGGQVDDEVVGRGQRLGVVRAENRTAAGKRVLVETSSLIVAAVRSMSMRHVVG